MEKEEISTDDVVDDTTDVQENTPPGVIKNRKVPFRWNKERDQLLISELQNFKPFLEGGVAKWKSVAHRINQELNANVDHIAVKRRFELLIREFKKEDFQNRYKSGTEEEVTIIKTKLADIASLIDDKKLEDRALSDQKTQKVNEEKQAAEEVREAALTTLKRKREVSDVEKKNAEKSLMQLWVQKQEADRNSEKLRFERESQDRQLDRELRMEELRLEREKLELDRKRMEYESKLHQERFALEKEERTASLRTQEALLNLLASFKK